MTTTTPSPDTRRAPSGSALAWTALGLAVVGFIAALIPMLAFIAWLPLVAAIIAAIVALVRRSPPKWASIVSIVVSVIGMGVAIIMSLVSLAGIAVSAIDTAPSPSVGSEITQLVDTATGDSTAAVVGEAVVLKDGTQFTVAATENVMNAPDMFGNAQPGNYLRVDFSVTNGSAAEITLGSSEIVALSGGSEFSADSSSAMADGEMLIAKSLNPGTSTSGSLYFAAPEGTVFDSVVFSPTLSFDSVTVSLV